MATTAQQSSLATVQKLSMTKLTHAIFFKEPSLSVQRIPKHSVLIFGRGMNVHIDKNGNKNF